MKPRTQGMQTIINLDDMMDFRIIDIGTMAIISNLNMQMLKLIREKKAEEEVTMDDLKHIQCRFRAIAHNVDRAHKVLLLHGQPVERKKKYERLRQEILREVVPCHRPLAYC